MSPAAAAATEAEAGGRQATNGELCSSSPSPICLNGYVKNQFSKYPVKARTKNAIAMSNEARYVAGKKLLEARKTEAAIELFQEILEEK